MTIIDRFSAHLKEIITRSIRLASELSHQEVAPIHLFFSIFAEKGSVAAEILTRFHINLQTIEQALTTLPTNPKNPPTRTKTITVPPLSAAAKNALEKALLVAQENGHNYVGSEHLLSGIVENKDTLISRVLEINRINAADLAKQLETVLNNATQFPKINDVAELVERVEDNLGEISLGDGEMPHTHSHNPSSSGGKKSKKKESALEFFATNLTSEEMQKNIDPVIGREAEIERLIHILCRRTKNNPILLGEPGVGKTAIVEGVAKRILAGEVPDMLLNKKIYALDMSLLIAGTIYRGEFEARLRQVIEEIITHPEIIVFIDEIHNIVGAGSNQGTMDAANILKPALSRGQIHCIGATTYAEFKKYIENDAALERRFQPIYVKESSVEDSIAILLGIKKNYELFHQITIPTEAVEASVKLADRYIGNKFLPDKAIDLLDETAAAKRVGVRSTPWQTKLWRLEQQLEKTVHAKETAAANDQFEKAVQHKAEEEKLRAQLKKVTAEGAEKKKKILGTISAKDVAEQVAKITGASAAAILLNEKEELTILSQTLKQHVIGQEMVIDEVAQTICQAKLGLSNPERPLASFLFVGESGVGKTELAKTIAKVLYPGKDALIKLDMSEFNEGFAVSKLLGSPAGYVGYKESNQFTDRIKLNPHSVILLDEIDKAHKDVTRLLLQMLENGEITDATGKKISLRHAIVILTSSLGAEEVKKGLLGFGQHEPVAEIKEKKKILVEKLKEHFSPEIINRLDAVCLFNPLTPAHLVRIAELEIQRLNARLEHYHTTITAPTEVITTLITRVPEKVAGAREIRRQIRGQIEELLASLILKQTKLKPTYTLSIEGEKVSLH